MSPGFDQRIADWLEDDPDDAPDAVLETVLAAFPSIPQRHAWRLPWRNRPMNLTGRLLAGAAALAVVLVAGVFILRPGVGLSVASSQRPSQSPTSAPASVPSVSVIPPSGAPIVLDSTFVSARYGYTVGYPATWTVTQATAPWTAGTQNTWGSGLNDELKAAVIRFSGASQALATGQTASQWLTAYAGGGDVTSWAKVTIGGLEGLIDYDGGPANGGTVMPGGRMFDAVVISGRLAFNFNMDGNVDRATFDAFLATVTLPVVPALDVAYTSATLGYSLRRPAAWSVAAASRVWSSGYNYDRASTDEFGGQETNSGPAQFAATSTKIPAGMTFDAWYAAYAAVRAGRTCGAPAAEESIQVDGVVGRLDVHCPTFYFEAVVEKGGRAYVFTVYNPETRPVLESILATVKLTPASAKN